MPTAKWHQEKTLRTVARIRREAAEWMKGIADGTNPEAQATWKERSVRTGCALALLGHQAAAERAAVAAKSVGASFGVVVIQQKIENHGEWEQFAKDRGQQVIDTTAGPALIQGGHYAVQERSATPVHVDSYAQGREAVVNGIPGAGEAPDAREEVHAEEDDEKALKGGEHSHGEKEEGTRQGLLKPREPGP